MLGLGLGIWFMMSWALVLFPTEGMKYREDQSKFEHHKKLHRAIRGVTGIVSPGQRAINAEKDAEEVTALVIEGQKKQAAMAKQEQARAARDDRDDHE